MITTTVIGAFPKIGDEPALQSLRRALHQLDRGEIDAGAMDAEYDRVTERVVRELDDAGIDQPNHGCVRWDDLFSPFVRAWANVEREALERFFDNNTYFRIPVVSGVIEAHGAATVHEWEVARNATSKPMKACLPGPLTFARLADDRRYRNFEELAVAAANALRIEALALQRAGCELIEIEEPALARWPEDFSVALVAYDELRHGHWTAQFAVHLTMFPADPIADRLASLPVGAVGIDVVSRPTRALERVQLAPWQTLVLGAVDARNTRLETPEEIARTFDAAAKRIEPERIWLSPTTSLEYLPHDVARAKLRVLVEGARAAVTAGGVR